jgi:hypothetical protein
MLPFKVVAVVACDDIRIEQSNKAILIGVYNGGIMVPGFPADIILTWWIQIHSKEKGKHELEVRVLKDGNSTLLRAELGIDLQVIGWSNLILPKAPLQFQSPGHLELEMRLKSTQKWDTLARLDVQVGDATGPHPPTAAAS